MKLLKGGYFIAAGIGMICGYDAAMSGKGGWAAILLILFGAFLHFFVDIKENNDEA